MTFLVCSNPFKTFLFWRWTSPWRAPAGDVWPLVRSDVLPGCASEIWWKAWQRISRTDPCCFLFSIYSNLTLCRLMYMFLFQLLQFQWFELFVFPVIIFVLQFLYNGCGFEAMQWERELCIFVRFCFWSRQNTSTERNFERRIHFSIASSSPRHPNTSWEGALGIYGVRKCFGRPSIGRTNDSRRF